MLKKNLVILINSKDNCWLQSKYIWFWESKTKHLNYRLNEFLKEHKGEEITNVQMY